MGKKLEIGKRYTWEEVQKAYPEKWVHMSDCTFGWGKSVVDGVFQGVYNDGETEELFLKLIDSNSDDILDRTNIGDTFCLR